MPKISKRIHIAIHGETKSGAFTITHNYALHDRKPKNNEALKLYGCMKQATHNKEGIMIYLNKLYSPTDDYIMRRSNGLMYLCDATNKNALTHLNEFAAHYYEVSKHPYICVVATKIDMVKERMISYDEGYAAACKIKANYYEISALSYEQISSVVNIMIDDIIRSSKLDKTIQLNYNPDDDLGGGCMGKNTCYI